MRAELIFVLALLTSCQTVAPTVKPTAPVVRCEKPAAGPLPAPPRAQDWVVCTPLLEGGCAAVLSERGASWIVSALSWARTEQSRRKEEHACIDALAKKGVIQN